MEHAPSDFLDRSTVIGKHSGPCGRDEFLNIVSGLHHAAADTTAVAPSPARGKVHVRFQAHPSSATLTLDGRALETNPFVGVANTRSEVWAWGLRNAWRNSFDRETGDLYIADVGQGQREEVNVQPADSDGGENYGWDVMEGTTCFNEGSFDNPLANCDNLLPGLSDHTCWFK